MVQCHSPLCYHSVTSEDYQCFHHGGRTDSHEDDVHEDPYYDMTDTWYNPVDSDIKHIVIWFIASLQLTTK